METRTVNNEQTFEIDIIKLLFTFLHRWWIFAICGVVAMAAASIYSMFFLTPLYQSSISIFVNNRMDHSTTDYISSSDVTTSRNLVTTYITIANSDRVMADVADALDGRFSADYLKRCVSAQQQNNTELFIVTVTTPSAEDSALIANTLADVLPTSLSDIVEGSTAKVLDYAKVATSKSSPNNTRNALIGLLLGVVLAAIIVFIEYVTDVRVKEEDDIAAICDYPILGQIPDFATIGNKSSSGYAYKSKESKK